MNKPEDLIIKRTEMWCVIGMIIAAFTRITDFVLLHGFLLLYFEIRRQGVKDGRD